MIAERGQLPPGQLAFLFGDREEEWVSDRDVMRSGMTDKPVLSTRYGLLYQVDCLTIRMQLRRFTSLTNGFSKKRANLKAMLALYFRVLQLLPDSVSGASKPMRIAALYSYWVTERPYRLIRKTMFLPAPEQKRLIEEAGKRAIFVGDAIDVGVEILPMKAMQEEMSSGPGYYEGALYDIARQGRGVPPVPLVLVGIEP